ncbi:hypothetical protein CIHG_01435 [Coccidioides immitis H538.4]|uniref:Uncharacterized protein n=3 Tax=Coccidioides immitis TaxID=5501 RepID=A0A0J8QP51_COCIT|nr:hypothetical protein CIRG_01288 [Coccidioides immitis RMSCC 2394]KMU74269.1 hypothetical protein CISG_04618 [Coccidioides immitis RMSCC 3703]KMU83652.1 hypothetical protein CIHG_01435 [Coccidioides immitis H538.4]
MLDIVSISSMQPLMDRWFLLELASQTHSHDGPHALMKPSAADAAYSRAATLTNASWPRVPRANFGQYLLRSLDLPGLLDRRPIGTQSSKILGLLAEQETCQIAPRPRLSKARDNLSC